LSAVRQMIYHRSYCNIFICWSSYAKSRPPPKKKKFFLDVPHVWTVFTNRRINRVKLRRDVQRFPHVHRRRRRTPSYLPAIHLYVKKYFVCVRGNLREYWLDLHAVFFFHFADHFSRTDVRVSVITLATVLE